MAFKKPNVDQFVQPKDRDAVDRVVAAGVKLMYAPNMRAELRQAVDSDTPVPQKLAENAAGLLLILDQKAKGKIPVAALFPAALALLGEAAEVLIAAGQEVTQEVYNEAAQMLFVLLARKMGASDEQVMQASKQALAQRGAHGDA